MNHNLKLNDDAATDVRQALADITMSVASARARIDAQMNTLPARFFDNYYSEIRAALGTIADAQWRIDQIVFHTDQADSEYAVSTIENHLRPASPADEFPDRHPCIEPGCEHTVQFDDEPYCYTHSPDEGSSVRGYSYREAAALAAAYEAQS